MNGNFQWFGFSVARKHVYFYIALIAFTVVSNAVKDCISVGDASDTKHLARVVEVQNQLKELARQTLP